MFRLVSLHERILRRADGIGRGSSGTFLASYWIHGTQCAVPLLHQPGDAEWPEVVIFTTWVVSWGEKLYDGKSCICLKLYFG